MHAQPESERGSICCFGFNNFLLLYTVWHPLSHDVFCSFLSEVWVTLLGSTEAAISALRPMEHFTNALQNIMTDRTPHSVHTEYQT